MSPVKKPRVAGSCTTKWCFACPGASSMRSVRPPRSTTVPSGASMHPLGRRRQHVPVEAADGLHPAVDLGRAGEQLRRVDHVPGAAGVDDEPRRGEPGEQRARAGGVVEVHVGDDDVAHLPRARSRCAASAAITWGTLCAVPVSITAALAPPFTIQAAASPGRT